MKKLTCLFMVFALAFMIAACGESKKEENKVQEKTNSEDTVAEDTSHIIENGIDTEEGTIKFLGMETANKKLTSNSENAWVFEFEYSNKLSDPIDMVNKYEITVFQNGVECDRATTWNGEGGEQYDCVSNSYDKVMDGGKLNCGLIFYLSEEAPVKIFIEENSTGKSVSFEVDKPQIVEVTAEDIEAALVGVWKGDSNGMEISLGFDGGDMTFSANGLTNQGTYTIDTENSVIQCYIASSTGEFVNAKFPYAYENGKLRILNNEGEEIFFKN